MPVGLRTKALTHTQLSGAAAFYCPAPLPLTLRGILWVAGESSTCCAKERSSSTGPHAAQGPQPWPSQGGGAGQDSGPSSGVAKARWRRNLMPARRHPGHWETRIPQWLHPEHRFQSAFLESLFRGLHGERSFPLQPGVPFGARNRRCCLLRVHSQPALLTSAEADWWRPRPLCTHMLRVLEASAHLLRDHCSRTPARGQLLLSPGLRERLLPSSQPW